MEETNAVAPFLTDDVVTGRAPEEHRDYYTEEIRTPEAGTRSISSSGTAGLRVDTGTYKVVYLAFGFEAVDDATDRAAVMEKAIDWLLPEPTDAEHRVTSVNDKSFTISWISGLPEQGQVNWGTSPDSLTNIAYDDRGQVTEDDTHHATIGGLTENTTYYYEIVSGGTTYDNDGAPYQITIGPSLTFAMPEIIHGTVYRTDGTTPAEGAIIYGQIGTSSSQVLSSLVDTSGNWALDIAPVRTSDYQSHYSYSDGDDMVLRAQGAVDGEASLIVTVGEAKAGTPDMILSPNYAPTIQNVTALQDAVGTVFIQYDVSDQDEEDTSAEVSFAFWNGTAYVPCANIAGAGAKVVSTTPTHYTATWDAQEDFDSQYLTDARIKVLADDGHVAGIGESTSADFTLDTKGPDGVACTSPGNQATDVELSPTLVATETIDPSGPVSYRFSIARNVSFTVSLQQSGWLTVNEWVPSAGLQAPEVTYFWKVEAMDSFGNITESSVFTFTTLAVVPVTVDLVDGWSIVALAALPSPAYTASTLAADINGQGGNVGQVFWWNAPAGSWDFWLVDLEYGTDFEIETGYGYLLSNAGTTTWTYWGVPLSAGYTAVFEPRVSNVGDKAFTVSWVSQNAEQGRVHWGTSPDALDQTAHDDRGDTTEDDTHYVSVTGLAQNTTCYYLIVSGTAVHNNGGVPYEVTTGPSLDFQMPDVINGAVYQADGTTPAEGAIVYARIGAASSQVLSALVDSSGNWALDIAPARAEDFQSYYAYGDGDVLVLDAHGAAEGTGAEMTTVGTAKAGAPDMVVSLMVETELVEGWNLIALPIMPATTYTASTLAAEINSQGGSVSQVFWWNGPAGSWDFWLVDIEYGTDFDIEMGEGYLLNNGTPVTWEIGGGPDLIVADITYEPLDYTPNEGVTFTLTFENIGNEPADVCRIRFKANAGNAEYETEIPAIPAGQTYVLELGWTSYPEASYFTAEVDHTDVVDETDETNNTRVIQLDR